MQKEREIEEGDWITYKYITDHNDQPILRKYIGVSNNLQVRFLTTENEEIEGLGFPMFYRLATEGEIRRMKLKKLFVQ